MAPEQFLEYEVALLLAKYGERRVASALAAKLRLSPDQLERKLSELAHVKPKTSNRKPLDAMPFIESLAAQAPEKAANLRLLFTRFQNKTFLPELKDVRRFLERHSSEVGTVKSRVEMAPRLFKLLSTVDVSELTDLCEGNAEKEYSSLGIISDQIMRRG